MEVLKKFAAWFVAGVGLAVGALSVILAVSAFDDPGIHTDHVDHPAQIRITDVQSVDFTQFLAVTGTLTNAGKGAYSSSYLEVALTRNGKVLFTCGDVDSTDLEPGHSARFQIVCESVQRNSIPTNVGYRVSVLRATIK